MIQNGIYFIEEFPNHYFSQLLVYEVHEYTRFAQFPRQKVKETVERYQQEKVNQLEILGENVCTVVGALQREVAEVNKELNHHRDIFQEQVINMHERMVNLQTAFIRQNNVLDRISLIQEQLTTNIAEINHRQEQMVRMIDEIRNNPRNNNLYNQQVATNAIHNDNNNTVQVNVILPTAPVPLGINPPEVTNTNETDPQTLIQNQRNRRPRVNALLGLACSPRIPPMAVLFPSSWLELLEEWNINHLSSFVGYGKRQHFSTAENSRFSKRCRAMNQIKRAAIARGVSLRDCAEQLDGERNFRIQQAIANRNGPRKFSLTNHLEELEQNDPLIRRRGNGLQL